MRTGAGLVNRTGNGVAAIRRRAPAALHMG
jgi:hypothetical protein